MNVNSGRLPAGLYLVGTPIGAARDITLRALDVLAGADVLAAEDTRSMRRLLDIHGIALGDRPLISYHDHNGARARPRLMRALEDGKSVAYASEAGMPLIADPGFDLVRAAHDGGFAVTSAPGPSAVVTALALAGLPSDRFFFQGFLPSSSGKRRSALESLLGIPATLIFYESPKRLSAMLADAATVLGEARTGCVVREMTKKFEEVRKDTLAELCSHYTAHPARGEIVVLIDYAAPAPTSADEIEQLLVSEMATKSVKDAVAVVVERFGLKRRDVYQLALELQKDD